MDSQPWLDRVRQRLARHALPPSYVQRFIEELSDHLEDLKEENMESNASSRLGKPEQVADNAVAAYRQRSFRISSLTKRRLALALLLGGLLVLSAYRLVWHIPSPIMNPVVAGQYEHVR